MENYKIVYGGSPMELTNVVTKYLQDGWEIVGSHRAVVIQSTNQFRGDQHTSTRNEIEYSQTMSKKTKTTIEVDISFYHPNDDETKRVYDEEGMREEFEYKMDCIIRNAGL